MYFFQTTGRVPQRTVIFILVVNSVRMSNFAMFGLIFMSINFMPLDQKQDFADVDLLKPLFFISLQNNRCLRILYCCCVISLHLLVHYIYLASSFSPITDYALLSYSHSKILSQIASESDFYCIPSTGNWPFAWLMFLKYNKTRGAQIFQKPRSHFKNSRRQKGDVQQVPYWGPTNIRRHRTKPSRHGALELGVCVTLL